jgi:hypothetical protein
MAAAVKALDEIIKEYLLFRGFTNTLKTFEAELKLDKDKSFRVSIQENVFASFSSLRHGIKSYNPLGLGGLEI